MVRSSLSLPTAAYHGAFKPPVDASPTIRWEVDRCAAFVHDIMTSSTLPDEYGDCDVLVTDLPWQRGFDEFNKRADAGDRDYGDFMNRVGEIAESFPGPVYLVTGRHAAKKLPTADVELPMQLNVDAAVAFGYRPGDEADRAYGAVPEFVAALAQQYSCGGDFCAGYGSTARFFLRAGKDAVVSDFNSKCIGYIAAHAPEWVA